MSVSPVTGVEYCKINDYFNKAMWTEWVVKIGGFGTLCLLSIFIEWTPGFLAGVIAIGIAIAIYKIKISSAPSDHEIDMAWNKIAQSRIPEALRVANYDEEDCIRPTEYMLGYSFGLNGGPPKKTIKGKDGYVRSNYMKLVYVIYGRDQIMTFEEAYCIANDLDGLDKVSEYFYSDVSGVEFDQNINSFLLKTSGGNIEFSLTGEDGAHEKGFIQRAQDISNSIRAVLRERKSL